MNKAAARHESSRFVSSEHDTEDTCVPRAGIDPAPLPQEMPLRRIAALQRIGRVTKSSPLRRRLSATAGGQAIAQALQTAQQFFFPPIFLATWGTQRYGTWLMLSALPTFLSWSDFGLGSAATNEIAVKAARRNWQAVREAFQSNLALQFSIVATGLAAMGGLLLSVSHVGSFDPSSGLRWAIWFLCIYVSLGMLGGAWSAGYRGIQRYSRWLQWQNGARLAEIAAVLVVLVCRGGEPQLAATMAANRLVWFVATVVDFGRLQDEMTPGFSHASWRSLRALMRPAVGHFCFPVGQSLSLQATTLLVGSILGPAQVAIFATARTFSRFLLQPMSIVNVSTWPEFSYALGTNDLSLARKLYQRTRLFSLAVAGIGGTLAFLLGPVFIGVWTRHRLSVGHDLIAALLLAAIVNLSWSPGNVVLVSVNQVVGMAWRYLMASAMGLALMAFLLKEYGLWQGACALLVAELAMLAYVPTRAKAVVDGGLTPDLRPTGLIAGA